MSLMRLGLFGFQNEQKPSYFEAKKLDIISHMFIR